MDDLLVIVGWILVGAQGLLLVTQFAGRSGSRPVVIMQALAHYLLALAIPITVLAAVAQRWALAVAAGVVVAGAIVLSEPLLRRPTQAVTRDGATPVRVFHSNLLYENGRPRHLVEALEAVDADILAFTEYTEAHAALLHSSELAERYRHRIEHPVGLTGGSAIWSRYPLAEVDTPDSRDRSSGALLATPEPFVLYVVHPSSPLMSLAGWNRELGELRSLHAHRNDPALVVGDFNADHWHPPFRRLLACGWRDAHHLLRRGFSPSWPTDRRLFPPFTRLDHALVNDHLVGTDVRNG